MGFQMHANSFGLTLIAITAVVLLSGCGGATGTISGSTTLPTPGIPSPSPTLPTNEALAFIPNMAGNVQVIAVPSNSVIATLSLCCGPDSAATSARSPYALFSQFDSATVTEIDTRTGAPVQYFGGCQPWGVAIDTTGTIGYITQECSFTLFVVSLPSLSQIGAVQFPTSCGGMIGVAVNPIEPLLYVACGVQNNQLAVISTTSYEILNTISLPFDRSPYDIVVSPDGSRVYVSTFGVYGYVEVIDANSDAILDQIAVGGASQALAVTPDGSKIYAAALGFSAQQDGTVSVISTATDTVVTTIPVGLGPNGVSIDPTGTYVYVTNANDGTISVISTSSNSVVATISVGGTPVGFGNFIRPPLAVGTFRKTARLPSP